MLKFTHLLVVLASIMCGLVSTGTQAPAFYDGSYRPYTDVLIQGIQNAEREERRSKLTPEQRAAEELKEAEGNRMLGLMMLLAIVLGMLALLNSYRKFNRARNRSRSEGS